MKKAGSKVKFAAHLTARLYQLEDGREGSPKGLSQRYLNGIGSHVGLKKGDQTSVECYCLDAMPRSDFIALKDLEGRPLVIEAKSVILLRR